MRQDRWFYRLPKQFRSGQTGSMVLLTKKSAAAVSSVFFCSTIIVPGVSALRTSGQSSNAGYVPRGACPVLARAVRGLAEENDAWKTFFVDSDSDGDDDDSKVFSCVIQM